MTNTKLSIILFDDDCLICNRFVRFIHKNDKHNRICFTSFNSETGIKMRDELPNSLREFDSVIFFNNGQYFFYSDAILNILKQIGGLWKYIGIILLIIPKTIRDYVYYLVAKNRYDWFGKIKSCQVPSNEIREKII